MKIFSILYAEEKILRYILLKSLKSFQFFNIRVIWKILDFMITTLKHPKKSFSPAFMKKIPTQNNPYSQISSAWFHIIFSFKSSHFNFRAPRKYITKHHFSCYISKAAGVSRSCCQVMNTKWVLTESIIDAIWKTF